jgi:hypothetical protein
MRARSVAMVNVACLDEPVMQVVLHVRFQSCEIARSLSRDHGKTMMAESATAASPFST